MIPCDYYLGHKKLIIPRFHPGSAYSEKVYNMADRKYSLKGPLCMLVGINIYIAENVFFFDLLHTQFISKLFRMAEIKHTTYFISAISQL